MEDLRERNTSEGASQRHKQGLDQLCRRPIREAWRFVRPRKNVMYFVLPMYCKTIDRLINDHSSHYAML